MFQLVCRFFLIVGLVVAIAGCASHQATRPSGAWSNVNRTAQIQIAKPSKSVPTSITLASAITQYAPPTYRLSIDPDVDMSTVILYDHSKNWLEALAQGMSDANIEFTANLYKKTGTIKRSTVTLAELIDAELPNEYTVFSDATLSQDAIIHYDHRKHWIDALTSAAAEAGIDLKVDFTQRVIYLKQVNKFGGFSKALSNSHHTTKTK